MKLVERSGPETVRVGLFGLLGSGNLGNDGSLDALVTHLRSLDSDVELGFFCMGAETIAARYGSKAVHLQWYEPHAGSAVGLHAAALKVVGKLLDPFRTLLWVRGFDTVIVPGMGVLEATVPVRPWALPYSLFCLAVSARATGARMALVAVGADEVRRWATRQLIVGAARLASYRSYRDELSRAAMRAMTVDVSDDDVYPDLVFSLPRPARREVTGRVAVGIMNYRGSNDDRARAAGLHEQYLTAMVTFVVWLLDSGRGVRLFGTDQEDEPVVEALLAAVRRERSHDADVERQATSTIQELMDGLAAADVVVGSRYHNVLCGLMLSKPTLSIGYAAKHEALMLTYGMADFSEPAREVNADRLITKYQALEADHARVVAALDQRNAEISLAAEEQLRALTQLVLGEAPRRPTATSAPQAPGHG